MLETSLDCVEPARSVMLELAGLKFHVVQGGRKGPWVVFLHGFTDSWQSFELVLPSMMSECRVLAIDLRGHGLTEAPWEDYAIETFARDVVDLLDLLGIASVNLVGHSMGSFIARCIAWKFPERIDRLVLVGSGLRSDNVVVRELRAQVELFHDEIPRSFIEEFQTSCVLDPRRLPDGFLAARVDTSASVPIHVWKGALSGMLSNELPHPLSEIQTPTLVLGGTHDTVFSAGDQESLAAALPNARIALYERCGHSPHWEHPARFSQDLLHFVGDR